MPVMTCPTCSATIPIGPLAAKCNVCGFSSSTCSLDDLADALKKGAAERHAAERTLKRSPRR